MMFISSKRLRQQAKSGVCPSARWAKSRRHGEAEPGEEEGVAEGGREGEKRGEQFDKVENGRRWVL